MTDLVQLREALERLLSAGDGGRAPDLLNPPATSPLAAAPKRWAQVSEALGVAFVRLGSCDEHLHLMVNTIERELVFPTFTLSRIVIEHAARAWWTLCIHDPDEVARRVYGERRQEAHSRARERRLIPDWTLERARGLIDEVERIASELGLTSWTTPPHMGQLLDDITPAEFNGHVHYSYLSEHSHSNFDAFFSLLTDLSDRAASEEASAKQDYEMVFSRPQVAVELMTTLNVYEKAATEYCYWTGDSPTTATWRAAIADARRAASRAAGLS